MKQVRLITVGGFLGAGKTLLLAEAARLLIERGYGVGLITNDQAPDLVDTSMLTGRGLSVREVAGSCFCCNFNALVSAASALRNEEQADVILAEPVGSCTDLSATILQPLKDKYAGEFKLSPLTVLVDPQRVLEVLGGASSGLHADAVYILRKQLEEADIIAISKIDLLTSDEAERLAEQVRAEFGGQEVRLISALNGAGIDPWLDDMLTDASAGRRVVDVDYDVYAHGEAVLGWVNATFALHSTAGQSGEMLSRRVMDRLSSALDQSGSEVGHIKSILTTEKGDCVANLTRTHGRPSVVDRSCGEVGEGELTVNARVQMNHKELEQVVRNAVGGLADSLVRVTPVKVHSLEPGRPVPSHRYREVVT